VTLAWSLSPYVPPPLCVRVYMVAERDMPPDTFFLPPTSAAGPQTDGTSPRQQPSGADTAAACVGASAGSGTRRPIPWRLVYEGTAAQAIITGGGCPSGSSGGSGGEAKPDAPVLVGGRWYRVTLSQVGEMGEGPMSEPLRFRKAGLPTRGEGRREGGRWHRVFPFNHICVVPCVSPLHAGVVRVVCMPSAARLRTQEERRETDPVFGEGRHTQGNLHCLRGC